MDTALAKALEKINKLIFVKHYNEAERLLDGLIVSNPDKENLIIHLRKIELAAKLGRLNPLRQRYAATLTDKAPSPWNELCMLFLDQHADVIPPEEALQRYQEIMKIHGPSAAAYYGMGFTLEAMGNHERALYNYNQSVTLDPEWFPSYFGLSQIYYTLGDEKKGDQYFYQFESAAPFNVYGNFETHRKLSQDFLAHGKFIEAEAAIQTLTEWWMENKGHCPIEIQAYEAMATSRIHHAQGDNHEAENRRNRGKALASQILASDDASENALYFMARVLEEFDEFQMAFRFYRKILKIAGSNPQIVQKIGGQFLGLGEFDLAKTLFEEAYEHHPDSPEIRFCRLVANLKLAKVNVEEYLIGKERLRQLTQNSGDRVEILALLHSLVAKFPDDSEVQSKLGEIYQRIGNYKRAERHFEKMYELDSKSAQTALKYSTFLMQHGNHEVAMTVLKKAFPDSQTPGKEDRCEIGWIRSTYHFRKGDFDASQNHLEQILNIDPWNVSYLVQQAINQTHLHHRKNKIETKVDETLLRLAAGEESEMKWDEFDKHTEALNALHCYDLVYTRRKIRFLYASPAEAILPALITSATKFDAKRGASDFLRLLNTNFDSINIYIALGLLHKELWQLETAAMWFEQVLSYHGVTDKQKARAYLELADCLVWQGSQLPKAIEYAQLALDLGERTEGNAMLVLSHALLRSGQVKKAQSYLEAPDKSESNSPECAYLRGLIEYRNGNKRKANSIWKPLLTVRTETLRFHNIKQEILKYYFDAAPYLKAN